MLREENNSRDLRELKPKIHFRKGSSLLREENNSKDLRELRQKVSFSDP